MTNRLKIISTIGPKSNNSITIKKLINSGTSVFRLNGHADLTWHQNTIKKLISIKFIPILFDIPGSKLDYKELKNPIEIKNKKITLTIDKKNKKEKLYLDNSKIIDKFKR